MPTVVAAFLKLSRRLLLKEFVGVAHRAVTAVCSLCRHKQEGMQRVVINSVALNPYGLLLLLSLGEDKKEPYIFVVRTICSSSMSLLHGHDFIMWRSLLL